MHLYTQPAPAVNSPILLSMSHPILMCMVHAAAVRLLWMYDELSPEYTQPSAYSIPTTTEVGKADWLNNVLAIDRKTQRTVDPGDLNIVSADFNILFAFADGVNAGAFKECIVGEGWWTRRLVYTALVVAQRHQVKCIRALHEIHGADFGSNTRFQKEGYAERVRDWPEREHYVEALTYDQVPVSAPV